MKITSTAVRVAALGLAAGLAGCGGSSSSGTTTAAAGGGLARTTLAARANTICATASGQSSKYPAPADIAASAVDAAAYYDKIYPITDAETKELQALTPDSAAAADWQSFVSAQVAADSLLLTLKQKADAKDPTGLADLKLVAPAGMKVTAAAAKLGATTCASG